MKKTLLLLTFLITSLSFAQNLVRKPDKYTIGDRVTTADTLMVMGADNTYSGDYIFTTDLATQLSALIGGGSLSQLSDLTDVNFTSLQAGEHLYYNGSNWVNRQNSYINGVSLVGNLLTFSRAGLDAFSGSVDLSSLAGGGGLVDSVNGEVGTVVLTTDDISDTLLHRYTNDSDIQRLATTSGTNTGDQTLSLGGVGNSELTISGGNTVTLPSGGEGSSTAQLTTFDNQGSELDAENVADGLKELDINSVNDATTVAQLKEELEELRASFQQLKDENFNSNEGEIYRNEFEDLTGLITDTPTGTITIENPIGTAVLPQQALTIRYTTTGKNYASYNLPQSYDRYLIQCYFSTIKSSDNLGYKDLMQFGQNADGGSELAQITVNHHATNGPRIYGINLDNVASTQYSYFGKYVADGEWSLIGADIDRIAGTIKYYYNGTFVKQQTIGTRTLDYVTLGGANNAGTVLQFSSLTINTQQFSETVENDFSIGEKVTTYIDYTVKDDTNVADYTGMHAYRFDPDGGSNYVDGPLPFAEDIYSSYTTANGEVRFNRGVKHKLRDLTESHSISLGVGTTDADNNYIVSSYGIGDKAKLDTSIVADSGLWILDDPVNNIYKQAIANSTYIAKVWYNESMGLRKATTLLDIETYIGTYYVDAGDLYVRLWDGSDPSLAVVDIGSNTGFTTNDYCAVDGVHFRFSGISTAPYSLYKNNDFSQGSSASVSDYSFLLYNKFYQNWDGSRYDEQAVAGNSSASINLNSNGTAAYNTVEDSYIGIRFTAGKFNSLAAFNVVKNIIVNHITFDGSVVGGGTIDTPMRCINNLIYVSPRHADNDNYHMTKSQPGHGIVIQSGFENQYVEIINNISMIHYNHDALPWTGGANCVHLTASSLTANSIIDYNMYYRSDDCDTWGAYFSAGINNDFDAYKANLLNNTVTFGLNGGDPESHSIIATELPTLRADKTPVSGKWLSTNPKPTSTGNGYNYDFTQWRKYITKDASGRNLGLIRNIGAY